MEDAKDGIERSHLTRLARTIVFVIAREGNHIAEVWTGISTLAAVAVIVLGPEG